MLNVGYDASVLRSGVRSGVAVYTFYLIAAMLERADVSVRLFYGARRSDASEAALDRLRELGATVQYGPAPWRWSPDTAWWLGAPPMDGFLRQLDVFHAGDFVLPRRMPVPCVLTMHDVTTILFPRHHAWLNRQVHMRRLRWALTYADRVIAVSRATRDDVVRVGIPARRVDCIGEARAPLPAVTGERRAEIMRTLGLEGRTFVLTVGTLEPRKNHIGLVHAFESIDDAGLQLVIAGGRGWRYDATENAIRRSPARSRIRLLGSVNAETLAALYASARVFAYPSHYEGFGLPLLEAMGVGVPVVTSNRSSMPEVAGDAAVLVDPDSPADIRRGLAALLHDEGLRSSLIARGFAREASFSWQRVAAETLDCYRAALSQRRAGAER
ncbi:MAG TPA: glycosyltransferase family 1 protein [Longimicrobiales bacterium]